MKLLICFSLLLIALSSAQNCSSIFQRIFYCDRLVLRADIPLNINNSYKSLYLKEVNGSIGFETLSTMPQLEVWTISDSIIKSVENGAICSLPNLNEIYIGENLEFPTVTQSLLSNCSKVERLVLGDVNIESTALHSFLHLRFIFLRRLHVDRFQREFLRPLSHLKELGIRESEVTEIESGSLCSSSSLETIKLDSNKYLPHINKETFNNCDTVKNLEYINNPPFDLEEKTFSGFVNLKKARINQVRIVRLTKGHLEGLSNLERLQLERCDITTIDSDAFEGLGKLKRLWLQSNKLSEIDTLTFSHLTSLVEVILYQNRIKIVDNFRHPNLENFNVMENDISKIDPETVKLNLPKLKEMYGRGNNISDEDARDLRIKFKSLNVLFS